MTPKVNTGLEVQGQGSALKPALALVASGETLINGT